MVFRALSELLGVTLPYETLNQIRNRLREVAPHFGNRLPYLLCCADAVVCVCAARIEQVEAPSLNATDLPASSSSSLSSSPFRPYFTNFYMTNPIRCDAASFPLSIRC